MMWVLEEHLCRALLCAQPWLIYILLHPERGQSLFPFDGAGRKS
jgi:hypothetical protein